MKQALFHIVKSINYKNVLKAPFKAKEIFNYIILHAIWSPNVTTQSNNLAKFNIIIV